MTYRWRSTDLSQPRAVLNVGSQLDSITETTLLQSVSLIMSDRNLVCLQYLPPSETSYTYRRQETKPILEPRIVQSLVLACTTCPILAKYDLALVLTCEYSVLLSCKVGYFNFYFNEILECFLDEEEIKLNMKVNASTPALLTINEYAQLLVIVTPIRTLLVTLNLDYIVDKFVSECANHPDLNEEDVELDIDGASCIRGIHIVDNRIEMVSASQNPLVNLPDNHAMEGKNQEDEEMEKAKEGKILELDVIEKCTVWGNVEAGVLILVYIGKNNILRIFPLYLDPEREIWCYGNIVERDDGNKDLNAIQEERMGGENESTISAITNADGDREVNKDGLEAEENLSVKSIGNMSAYSVNKGEEPLDSIMILANDHETWITALSAGEDVIRNCVTGDALGALVFWSIVVEEKQQQRSDNVSVQSGGSVAEGKKKRVLKLVKEFAVLSLCNGFGVSSIVEDISDETRQCLLVGDESGSITYVRIVDKLKRVETMWQVRLFDECSTPMVCTYLPLVTNKNKTSDSTVPPTMYVYSSCLGIAYECHVQSNVALMFNTAENIEHKKGYKSVIQSCSILRDSDLLVTASNTNVANLWDLSSGALVYSLILNDFGVTAIESYDEGYVANGKGRILFGHTNGHTHSYTVQIYNKDPDQSSVSGINLTADEGPENIVTDVDILDSMVNDVEAEASIANTQGKTGKKGRNSDQDDETSLASRQSKGSKGSKMSRGSKGSKSAASGDVNDLVERIRKSAYNHLSDTSATNESQRRQEALPLIQDIVYENGTKYSPMPVSDIFVSSLCLYFAFIYGGHRLVVHEWESNHAIMQMDFDEHLLGIYVVNLYSFDDLNDDVFILALHGRDKVKLLDAIQGNIVKEFLCDPGCDHIRNFTLWHTMGHNYLPEENGLQQEGKEMWNGVVYGVSASNNLDVFVTADQGDFLSLQEIIKADNILEDDESDFRERQWPHADINTTQPHIGSKVDNLVVGGRGISEYSSPLASLWSMRRVFLLRYTESGVAKVNEYRANQIGVRVVDVTALKMMPHVRANRAVILLSNGLVYVMNI